MKKMQLVIMTVLVIVVSFILTTLVSVYSLRTVIRGNNEELSKALAAKVYESINTRMTEPVAVSQAMSANYYLLKELKEGDFPVEETENGLVSYLSMLSATRNYSSAFVVSERNHRYYTQDGFNKVIDPALDPHDVWYSTFISSGKMVDFDVDTDEAHGNQWTVFVNARVEDDAGRLLGVCGVSISMADLQEILKSFVDEYGVEINLTNDRDAILINQDEVAIKDAVLNSTEMSEYSSDTDYMYQSTAEGGYRVYKYMDNLNWLLEVHKDRATDNAVYASLIYQNLIIFGVILILMLALVTSNINKERKRSEAYAGKIEKYAKKQEMLKAKAESVNAKKDSFLADIGQEVRTPINAIIGLDDMIMRETDDSRIRSHAAQIHSSSIMLMIIVSNAIDLSMIESDRMKIAPAVYDTTAMLSAVLDVIIPKAEADGVSVSYEIDRSMPSRLYGDDMRIRQTIANLLIDAIDHVDEGTVALSVSSRPDKNGTVMLDVSVKSIGAHKDDHQPEKGRFSTGEIGVIVAKECISLMGGHLETHTVGDSIREVCFDIRQGIKSTLMVGSFDDIYSRKKGEKYDELFAAPDARILVVDDVRMNLLVFRELLRNTDVKIDTAVSGAEAIERLKENKYDIVFMDHFMPGMDGIETLQEMKKQMMPNISGTPFIAMTSNTATGAREMYIKNGFSDYMVKPIEGRALEAICIKWLPVDKVYAGHNAVDKGVKKD